MENINNSYYHSFERYLYELKVYLLFYAQSNEPVSVSLDGLREYKLYTVQVISRVMCSDYDSFSEIIQIRTLDGFALAYPIAEPGTYAY